MGGQFVGGHGRETLYKFKFIQNEIITLSANRCGIGEGVSGHFKYGYSLFKSAFGINF